MNAKKYSKKKILIIIVIIIVIMIIIKNDEIAHSCNLLEISFFKRCVKEDVVAAVFMFELTLFQILGPRNYMLFCPLIVLQRGMPHTICDLVLVI